MRTIVYVDGFNLYYGALRNTSFKWLDLKLMAQKALKPDNLIVEIKYFTARTSARPSDPTQPQRQAAYLGALRALHTEISIYYGHFLSHEVTAPLAKPTQRTKFARVIKTEEKGSDVNLAVHLLNDAWLDAFDCGVVVSNDSDLAEAMRLVKLHKKKTIGLLTPGNRSTSGTLAKQADFIKKIRPGLLGSSQMPDKIPGTKFSKPRTW